MSKKNESTLSDVFNKLDTIQSEFTTKLDDIYNKISEHLQQSPGNGECAKNANDIPDTEYVTIRRDGVFVGRKPATQYLDTDIYNCKNLPLYLVQASAAMKFEHGVGIIELHCLSSETGGTHAEPGNPSANHGCNCWCRAVFGNGALSAWVFLSANGSASACSSNCANDCGYYVRNYQSMRSGVFGSVDE